MSKLLKAGERFDHLFQYNLEIIQSVEVFSFSLDAILLADFARLPQHNRANILDLCAGNGAVTLMLSPQTKSKIYGLELQERLVDMANRSVEHNQLCEKVRMIQDDLKNAGQYFKRDSLDIITCNPPYFTLKNGTKRNPNPHLEIARHELHTDLNEVLEISSSLLKTNGKLFMVHRPDRLVEVIERMANHQIIPKRLRFVYPKKSKDANILLIEGIKNGKKEGLKILAPLFVIDDQGNYLPEVRSIIYGNYQDQAKK